MGELRITLLLFFFGLFGCFSQVQTEMTVTILETSPLSAEKGSDIRLTCRLNRGLPIILTHSIDWVKESRVPHLTNETRHISSQQTLEVYDESLLEHYEISLTSDTVEKTVTAVLLIKDVEEADDGRYVCKVTSQGSSSVVADDGIDVIIPRAADEVNLKVDGKEASVHSLILGIHTLLCVSKGSNPAGDVAIRVGNKAVTLKNPATSTLMRQESLKAGAPRYSVQAEASYDLIMAGNGTVVTCQAGEGEEAISVSTTLTVIAKPTVDCEDITVGRNVTNVRLVCVVKHAGVILEDFEWQMLESGGTVYSSQSSSSNDVVSSEKVGDGETRVFLNLDVERWGDEPAIFTLTVITGMGDVSDNSSVTVVSEDDEDTTDDNNTDNEVTKRSGDNTDDTSPSTNEGGNNGVHIYQPPSTILLAQSLLLVLIVTVLSTA